MSMQQRTERLEAIERALRGLIDCVNEQVVERLELTEMPVPEIFAAMGGLVGDVPIRMTIRRFHGEMFESLTLVVVETMSGTMMSVALIGIPAMGMGIPVLGIDLIAARGALSLVAVDLSATDGECFSECFCPLLEQLNAATREFTRSRHRPDDSADQTCTSQAFVVAARKGHESETVAALCEFLKSFADLLANRAERLKLSGEVAAAAYTRTLDWRRRELEYREHSTALAGIFGEAYAARLLREFLFVVPKPPQPAEGVAE